MKVMITLDDYRVKPSNLKISTTSSFELDVEKILWPIHLLSQLNKINLSDI